MSDLKPIHTEKAGAVKNIVCPHGSTQQKKSKDILATTDKIKAHTGWTATVMNTCPVTQVGFVITIKIEGKQNAQGNPQAPATWVDISATEDTVFVDRGTSQGDVHDLTVNLAGVVNCSEYKATATIKTLGTSSYGGVSLETKVDSWTRQL